MTMRTDDDDKDHANDDNRMMVMMGWRWNELSDAVSGDDVRGDGTTMRMTNEDCIRRKPAMRR